ncbi:MAG: protein-glutamate O-methyltransferase CheR [candidate division NC10 bacterium]|nr:protein-glutamate O-methyltransferase CheR [candidate division NC10 bacterium]
MGEEDLAWAALEETLQERAGLDLRLYKEKCVARRLAVRQRACAVPDLAAYVRLLREDPEELPRLLDALTINVTQFLRNPQTFRVLGESVLPDLCRSRAEGGRRTLRAWSAGCATGEEAYTLAILLQEVWRACGLRQTAVIYATDIDSRCLEVAKAARYQARQLDGLPPEVRVRCFKEEEGGWVRLAPAIRRMVFVKRHDLRLPPPFRRLDLILSRNVLIYLAPAHQQQLLHAFAEVLTPGGILVLGKVEGLSGPAREAFEPVNVSERIYRRRAGTSGAGGAAAPGGARA